MEGWKGLFIRFFVEDSHFFQGVIRLIFYFLKGLAPLSGKHLYGENESGCNAGTG